ncbi:MAG: 1-deoxy-D-xylulose-5-phosphate synthase [Candidatus Neomarinimicrobiota bacterium]|nr:MAG: 1-deoxy-D-xylulose-5-phosphate synthase [Candidatus Neomarinimicrobiota bacterium]
MSEISEKYKVLSKVDYPADLRKLNLDELQQLCGEIRHLIIETVEKTGGHIAPSLGAVELAVSLHYVLNTPEDKLIWDVGHQAYAHKIITGRKNKFHTLRQHKGISGFLKPDESEYDTFGAGHASTSISAAAGFAVARELKGGDYRIVTVIGDGSLTGGLAYEGINNIYRIKKQFLIVLNDNEMSISRNVGLMSYYLTKIRVNPSYIKFRNEVWNTLGKLPRGSNLLRLLGRKIDESIKNFFVPGLLFEELGLKYYGPIDGHDLEQLITTLNKVKDLPFPALLHVVTKKGKGLSDAEEDPTKFHGIGPIKVDPNTKEKNGISFSKVFGKVACEVGEKYPDTVFITAAMCEGTGLSEFARKFPDRFFDVGIAEGHAVTFAAGLAMDGMRPIVAIYSTFLQRSYDQLIHDVALQNLPVVFAMDRAGIVGEDGPTHHGAFDISYLNVIPNMIISAPKDGNELRNLVLTALNQKGNPFAIRYPRGKTPVFDEDMEPKFLEIGKWEVLREGEKVAILAVGVMADVAEKACDQLSNEGINPGLVYVRFIKPFDEKILKSVLEKYDVVITVEENALKGGFGVHIVKFAEDLGIDTKIVNLGIPDKFVEQGPRNLLLKEIGLSSENIARKIKELLR